jgi:Zn-dependent protease
MGMGDLTGFILFSLLLIPAVVIAIPAHEIGHGLAAHWMGDRSVRNRGLFALDLKQYFEPYGLLAAFLSKVAWGRPLPVNEAKLDTRGRKIAYALGGPLANLLLAIVFGRLSLFLLTPFDRRFLVLSPLLIAGWILYAIFFLNLSMFAFNLLPFPGLDGWRVAEALLRDRYPRLFFDAWMRRREIWGIAFLILVVASFLPGINLLSIVLLPIYGPSAHLILGGCDGYYGLLPCIGGL